MARIAKADPERLRQLKIDLYEARIVAIWEAVYAAKAAARERGNRDVRKES